VFLTLKALGPGEQGLLPLEGLRGLLMKGIPFAMVLGLGEGPFLRVETPALARVQALFDPPGPQKEEEPWALALQLLPALLGKTGGSSVCWAGLITCGLQKLALLTPGPEEEGPPEQLLRALLTQLLGQLALAGSPQPLVSCLPLNRWMARRMDLGLEALQTLLPAPLPPGVMIRVLLRALGLEVEAARKALGLQKELLEALQDPPKALGLEGVDFPEPWAPEAVLAAGRGMAQLEAFPLPLWPQGPEEEALQRFLATFPKPLSPFLFPGPVNPSLVGLLGRVLGSAGLQGLRGQVVLLLDTHWDAARALGLREGALRTQALTLMLRDTGLIAPPPGPLPLLLTAPSPGPIPLLKAPPSPGPILLKAPSPSPITPSVAPPSSDRKVKRARLAPIPWPLQPPPLPALEALEEVRGERGRAAELDRFLHMALQQGRLETCHRDLHDDDEDCETDPMAFIHKCRTERLRFEQMLT